ncbi:MAG: 3-phosphoshikimate 1-carboxyvinyltransferase [Desulfobacteraceae bacterium]|nr:3-phosphoshikimate 1-carboxyvinyltransferase [Desulfobacteraceae bacterium]
MKRIEKRKIEKRTVTIPGSKSISHRMMICASLCRDRSLVKNLLLSQDILLTIDALRNMGAKIEQIDNQTHEVTGFNGRPIPFMDPIYLGNSGTSMRLLAGICALGGSPYVLTGDERMRQRPMNELLEALNMMGITAESKNTKGTPPVTIEGKSRAGGQVVLDCSKSSQYLSALMMIGAFMDKGLDIKLKDTPVSSPYIDLTMDVMAKFNVTAKKISEVGYFVPGNQAYESGTFFVEPDLSNAGYFWSAGAVTQKMITVDHVSKNSLQGDLAQVDILEKMGCEVQINENSIGVCGKNLKGIKVDMADTPDAVPAISVVAGFAKGKTRISNIKHLRQKECDRIDAISSQLLKMGIQVNQGDDFLEITGGIPRGAQIETFNDHRIAMAFSVAGLAVEGIEIENETCVEKSFPNYWDIFDRL